jgi:hypothetical protein
MVPNKLLVVGLNEGFAGGSLAARQIRLKGWKDLQSGIAELQLGILILHSRAFLPRTAAAELELGDPRVAGLPLPKEISIQFGRCQAEFEVRSAIPESLLPANKNISKACKARIKQQRFPKQFDKTQRMERHPVRDR